MAIEDHYNTPFKVTMRSRNKVNGRYVTTFVEDATTYLGAVFTPTTTREVRVGKEDYVVLKSLYCATTTPIQKGDYVIIDSGEFEVGNIMDTNNLGHHFNIDLVSRVQ